MNIFLDIETLPSSSPAVRERIAARIKPPGTLKKAESIAAWEANEKPAAIDEAMAKTSFDGTYGSIAVIGFAFDGTPTNACSCSPASQTPSERAMLESFMRMLDQECDAQSRPVFIGHNLHGFDLPFLWKRCVINCVKPSPWLPFGAKAWDARIADTMLMWDDNRERRISLDNLCAALGVPTSKGELDGSKVAEYWTAGRHLEVIDYCRADIAATRECYSRMVFA